jgi:predicted MFS family arabinose efflux permease
MLVLGRRHSREALAIGAILFAVAFLVLLFAPLSTWQIPPMLLVYVLLGVYLTVRTLSLGVVSEHTPLDQQGTGFAMVETMFGAGVFLGPLAAGLLYDRSPHLPFALALAALLPLAALLWLNLRPAEWRET